MSEHMRRGLVIGIATLCLEAGCDKSRTLACGASIADACAIRDDCVLTWDEARVDTAICAGPTLYPPLRADCGSTHAVTVNYVDSAFTYYYDGTTGNLVAIVTVNPHDDTTACTAGPATGFTLPVCTGAASEPLPQCLDGGSADAAPG
jgi:hypothetical protein